MADTGVGSLLAGMRARRASLKERIAGVAIDAETTYADADTELTMQEAELADIKAETAAMKKDRTTASNVSPLPSNSNASHDPQGALRGVSPGLSNTVRSA